MASAGGVTDQVTVCAWPGWIAGKLTGEVAWLAQPCGAWSATCTSRSTLLPVLVMVADAVVCVPASSAGWTCWPAAVLSTWTPMDGRPASPRTTSTTRRRGSIVTVWVAAS